MKKITITNIDINGVSFTSKQPYQLYKEYNLIPNEILTGISPDLRFRATIIDASKNDDGDYVYRAMWRYLSKEQFKAVKEIIKVFEASGLQTTADIEVSKTAEFMRLLSEYRDNWYCYISLSIIADEFDGFVEDYNLQTWYNLKNDIVQTDDLLLECNDSLKSTAAAFEKLNKRSESKFVTVFKKVLASPERQQEIFGKIYKTEPEAIDDEIDVLLEAFGNEPHPESHEEIFELFLKVMNEKWVEVDVDCDESNENKD